MSAHDTLVEQTRATLERIVREFTPAVFASSLAAEDMVLTDMILKAGLPIGIFSLETGRLHPETLQMLDRVKETYGYEIAVYRPDPLAVDAEGLEQPGPPRPGRPDGRGRHRGPAVVVPDQAAGVGVRRTRGHRVPALGGERRVRERGALHLDPRGDGVGTGHLDPQRTGRHHGA